jgi:preprotein translocase subunit SecF
MKIQMKKYIFSILMLLFISINLLSQTNKKFNDSGSVKDQFDNLINKSNKYQDYKVVKLNWLQQLKANVNDSLTVSKKEILSSSIIINSQKNKIDSLKTTLSKTKTEIGSLNSQIQSISFLGIQFEKGFFKTIMLSIIGALALILIFFISKFKQSNSITKQTKSELKEVEEEYEEHRKKALEREQKVMRKLQDELNKQKKD